MYLNECGSYHLVGRCAIHPNGCEVKWFIFRAIKYIFDFEMFFTSQYKNNQNNMLIITNKRITEATKATN